jgi:soluble lytic murein transglycosylase-like protein
MDSGGTMDYVTMILAAAKSVKVPGAILMAICMHETGLKNITVQEDGGSPSYGLCQVKSDTAEMLGYEGKPEGLKNAKENIKWAAKYLRYQLDRYDGDMCKAVSAYNAGKYNESKKMPGYPRNLKYIVNVRNKLAKEYQKMLTCDRIYKEESAVSDYAENNGSRY